MNFFGPFSFLILILFSTTGFAQSGSVLDGQALREGALDLPGRFDFNTHHPWDPKPGDLKKSQIEWNKYFSGRARITDNLPDFEEQMNIDHLKCGQSVREILTLVQEYGEDVTNHDSQGADKTYKTISEKINSSGETKNDCLGPMKQAYVVGSSFILFKNPREYRSESSGSQWAIRKPYEPLSIALKVIYLFNQDKIGFLSKNLSQPILGAYQCESSKIYVSLNQRPYDTGATVIREMDHLFRDKFIPLGVLKKQFPPNANGISSVSQVDWRTYTLIDETLASSAATFAQRVIEFGLNDEWMTYAFTWVDKDNPYKAIDDFSFVAPHRPLETFLDYTHELPHPTILLRSVSEDDFPSHDVGCQPTQRESGCDPSPAWHEENVTDLKKANSYLDQVYNIVSQAYFGSKLSEYQSNLLKLKLRRDNPAYLFDYDKNCQHTFVFQILKGTHFTSIQIPSGQTSISH